MTQMAFLKDEFNLAPAEVRLLLRLIEGKSLRSSAAALGITYETARTALKRIFQKTGTCRQAELVVMIVNAMERQRAEYLGAVEAADVKASEAVTAEAFKLDGARRKRLAVRAEEGGPSHRARRIRI